MRVERVGRPGAAAAPTLVLLPAAATTADDFVREGFFDELDALGIDATVLSAAAPVDVYAADRVVALVKAQIGTTSGAAPAPIWFVGISLGAMTALACAEAHRARFAGVFAIAPWPGPRGLWSDVPAIGLAAWAARQREARFDDERRVWRWLGEGARGGPQVMIGYGRDDRFRRRAAAARVRRAAGASFRDRRRARLADVEGAVARVPAPAATALA